jgi:cell fate (sporulation/competence/biofilm development) regulator YlbF (YheA/YmcA/DUF963 family)
MRKSEIFENYIKIAQEKGLVSGVTSEQAKKKLEENPRVDSLSVKDIEGLYNTKPESPKDMKYDRNIMEKAHPKSVIIAPSHDKLNGLVENNNERQDIIMHILHKFPGGQLQNRKYAEKELILNLVRLGNDLDNNNKEELRVLADTCLQQMTKKAAAPLIPVAAILTGFGITVAEVAAVIGVIYFQQHHNFINEGFEKNHEKLITELDDFLNSSDSWQTMLGFGYEYKENFLQQIRDFKSKLEKFYNDYKEVMPDIEQVERLDTPANILNFHKQTNAQNILSSYNKLREDFVNMSTYITGIQKNFKNESYKLRQIKEKGFFARQIDRLQLLHGGGGIVADDFDDVRRAIPPYEQSIKDTVELFTKSKEAEATSKEKLEAANAETSKTMPSLTTPSTTTAPTSTTPSTKEEGWEAKSREGLGKAFEMFPSTK